MDDFYLIAEVQGIYSTDGSVIIKSLSDFSGRFSQLEEIVIDFFGKPKVLQIEFTEESGNSIIVKFRRFDSEDDVQFLLRKKLYVNIDDLHKLPKDSYYVHDLIDSEVYLDSLFFGKLIDVMTLPNNDIYVIEKSDGSEVMIPAVEKFIENIDLVKRKIILDIECKIFDEDEN